MVQISEAWMLAAKTKEGVGTEFVRPSESPDRKELIMVTLHTQFGSVPTMHLIKSSPTRHAIKGEFPKVEDIPNFGGRFALQEVLGPGAGTIH